MVLTHPPKLFGGCFQVSTAASLVSLYWFLASLTIASRTLHLMPGIGEHVTVLRIFLPVLSAPLGFALGSVPAPVPLIGCGWSGVYWLGVAGLFLAAFACSAVIRAAVLPVPPCARSYSSAACGSWPSNSILLIGLPAPNAYRFWVSGSDCRRKSP